MKYFILLVYTIFISFLFLYKPAPTGKWNGEYIRIKNGFGVFLSTDSYNFCREAKDLNLLFDTSSIRQDRPGYLVAVHLISIPIEYFTRNIEQLINLKEKIDFKYLEVINNKILKNSEFLIKSKPKTNILIEYRFVYLSFVVLNIVVLFLTLVLFYKLLSAFKINKHLKIVCLVLLSINRVVKAYIFASHMQLFILLTPVLFLYSIYVIQKSGYQKEKIFLHSAIMGFMCLFYGSFIFYFPILFLTSIIHFESLKNILSKWYIYFIAGVFCLFPTLLWVSILTNLTGVYYNHEVEHFREYVWIVDKLSISFSAFIITSIKFYVAFVICILKSSFIYIIIYILLLKITIDKGLKIYRNEWFIQFNIIMVILLAFLLLLGFYQPRLTFIISPILFLLSAILIQEIFNLDVKKEKKLISLIYISVFIKSIFVLFSNTYYQ